MRLDRRAAKLVQSQGQARAVFSPALGAGVQDGAGGEHDAGVREWGAVGVEVGQVVTLVFILTQASALGKREDIGDAT